MKTKSGYRGGAPKERSRISFGFSARLGRTIGCHGLPVELHKPGYGGHAVILSFGDATRGL